jgi:hypothetical protein
MRDEMAALGAQIDADKAKLAGGALDKETYTRVQAEVQKLQFQFDLLGVKTEAIQLPLQAELTNWVNSFGTSAHQIANVIEGTINAALQGTNQLLLDAVFQTGDWRQTLVGVERQILNLFLTWMEQMALQFLLGETHKATGTATSIASHTAAMPSATAHAAAEGISSYGWAAIIGAAAVIAAIAAIEGAFHEGGVFGVDADRRRGRTGPLGADEGVALLRDGEVILTPEQAEHVTVAPYATSQFSSAQLDALGKGRETSVAAGSIPSSLIQGAEPPLPTGGFNAPQIVDFDPGEIEPGNLPGAWAIGANNSYNPSGPVPIPPGFFDPLGPTVEINPGGPVRVPYYDPSAPFDANQLATNWTLSQLDVGPYQFGDRPMPYFGGVPTSGSVVPPNLGGMILIRDDAGNLINAYTTTDRGTSLTGDDITGGLQIPGYNFSGSIGTVIDASGRPVPVTDVDYFGRPIDARGNVIPTAPGTPIIPPAPTTTASTNSPSGNPLLKPFGTSRNYGDPVWATNVHDPEGPGYVPPPTAMRRLLAAAGQMHGDLHFALGGRIAGMPSSSDNVLNWNATGEHIINAAATQWADRTYGADFLDSINARIPRIPLVDRSSPSLVSDSGGRGGGASLLGGGGTNVFVVHDIDEVRELMFLHPAAENHIVNAVTGNKHTIGIRG